MTAYKHGDRIVLRLITQHDSPDGQRWAVYESARTVSTMLTSEWDALADANAAVWEASVELSRKHAERAAAVERFGIPCRNGSGGVVGICVRVTKTQIVIEGTSRRHRRSDGWAVGQSGWSRSYLSEVALATIKARAGDRDNVDFVAEGLLDEPPAAPLRGGR